MQPPLRDTIILGHAFAPPLSFYAVLQVIG